MDAFIARQPILGRQKNTFGYELLFRSGPENVFRHDDPDQATLTVIDNSLSVMGLDSLIGSRKGFINMTRRMLVENFAEILPPERIILEVLENVKPDREVIEACKRLKESGFDLALDDYILHDSKLEPLLELAKIVKVDFMGTDRLQRRKLARGFSKFKGLELLAEKVETGEEFQEALDLGYRYFQGYFFSKPEMIREKEIPRFKLNYIRFLKELNRPDMDFSELEEIIRTEVSLSVRLLKYLNSASMGLRAQVTSIKHALTLLGERPLRKWASMLAVSGLGEDKPDELVLECLIRARFCDTLAEASRLKQHQTELFLAGLLSSIDALMDRPLEELLCEIAVPQKISQVLLGTENELSPVFRLVMAYEGGQWKTISARAEQLGIEESILPGLYLGALEWAEGVFGI